MRRLAKLQPSSREEKAFSLEKPPTGKRIGIESRLRAIARLRRLNDWPFRFGHVIFGALLEGHKSARAVATRGGLEQEKLRLSSALLAVQAAPNSDENINERWHQNNRQNDLGEHLAEDPLAHREDAVKGDGDKDQRIDDLA